jgi:hypothetical protein
MIDTKVFSKTGIYNASDPVWHAQPSWKMGVWHSGYALELNGKNKDLDLVLENPGSLKVSGMLCYVRTGIVLTN